MNKILLIVIISLIITNITQSQTISVTFPNGGEEFIKNVQSPHNIRWTSTGVSSFKLEYSDDNGSTWNLIEDNYTGGNFYNWLTPNIDSDNFLIKVSEASGTVSDQSNGTFKISSKQLYIAEWTTTMGTFRAELRGDLAPVTSQNFINLTEMSFYTDLIFHRVISGFMIQDGCPNGDGTGGPGYEFDNEISPLLRHNFPGVLAMANAGADTNGSQYYITVAPTTWLDDSYSIFGRIIDGMDVVYAISEVETDSNDKPLTDVTLSVNIVESNPQLSMVFPANAGSKVEVGRTINIDWESDFVKDVKIEFSSDNGTSWETLTDSIPSDNESFRWTVPNTLSTNCFIKITDINNPAVTIQNTTAFEIRNMPVTVSRYSFFDNVTAPANNPENIVMPSKTFNFKIKVLNNSDAGLNSMLVNMTSDNSDVVIENSQTTFPSVTQSGEEWANIEYTVTLPESIPSSNEYTFDFYGTDPSIEGNFWLGSFKLPILSILPFFISVDDDNTPDSQGNNNKTFNPGETIEMVPKFDNKSSQTLYRAYGKLNSPNNFINIWNNVLGSDGMVYDTAYYNNSLPIAPGSSAVNILSGRDFVFDYNANDTYLTNFLLEVHCYLFDEPGANYNDGGTLVNLGIPFTRNSSYPSSVYEEDIYSFKILSNPVKEIISFKYDFTNLTSNKFSVTLIDITGKKLKSLTLKNKKGIGQINVASLKGFYILKIDAGKKVFTKKIIVE